MKHGVPQGSILGPLLFLIYINDITCSAPKLEYLLFADDTALFLTAKNQLELQTVLNQELGNIANWLKANKLSLNVDKSKLINFSKIQSIDSPLRITINGEAIEQVKCAKYLGVLIDDKLSYRDQVDCVGGKIRKGNSILYKLRKFLPVDKIKNVYFAHVHSHINYCIGAWGGCTKTNLSILLKKQAKSLNIMFFKNQQKIKNVKIPNVLQMRDLNWSKKIWRVSHGYNVSSLFALEANLTKNPRDNTKYLVPFKGTLLEKNSIFFSGIKQWNKMPSEVRNAHNFGLFCSHVKRYLIK